MRPIRVQIVQPVIPEYRAALFRRLAARDDLRVKVCASRSYPDAENLNSVDLDDDFVDLEHPCVGFCGNRFLWQRGLRLDHGMVRGDVLVLCGSLRFLSNVPLVLAAKRRGVGVIWWGHGFSKRRNRFKDLVNRILVRLVDGRLLYTDSELDEYKRLGCPAEKLFATNNAFDETPIMNAIAAWQGRRLDEFREREGLVGQHLLLFCGRRTTSVSLELAFAALARLRASGRNASLAVIGPVDTTDAMLTHAKAAGVENHVRWLGPLYDQHALAPWFLSASCLVYPGPIGLSLIHSFFYGLPVVLADCEHGPEIAALQNGENGLLFKSGDARDMAQKISMVIDSSGFRGQLSATAVNTVASQFTLERMIDRCVAAFFAVSRRMSRSRTITTG